MRLSTCTATVLLALISHAGAASASEVRTSEAEDDTIGTRPARSSAPVAAAPDAEESALVATDDVDRAPRYHGDRAPIAKDPPPDWAVLHAGLRPELGTFGGIATFAIAHARTERFYGAMSMSAVRNDAGTHVGVAQLALGRNLADDFKGGVQLSLTENRARNFIGLGQTGLAYNRAGEAVGVFELAAYNRARVFTGAAQIGFYDRTDDAFRGLVQAGGFNHARKDFTGAAQVGFLNAVGRPFGVGPSGHRFGGIGQIGVVNTAGAFFGVAQLGAAAFAGDFTGLVQVGALGSRARRFKGLAQVGGLALSEESLGLQLGAAAVSLSKHEGLQLGALGTYTKSTSGAQVGLVNVADEVKGVQIGVFNHARRLRGMQIGLTNHAEDGVLPWTALLNFGFGDTDDEPRYDLARR